MADPVATRVDLHRVATHVLARRRHDVTGRFGLRASPGGFATPAFGPADALEVLRVSPTHLVREVGGSVQSLPWHGATLAWLAEAVGVDLAAPLDVGHDTPPVGDPAAPLRVDPRAVARLADWLDLGWRALDAVLADAPDPGTVQLWPEHFDAGTSVAIGSGNADRVNLGVSLGDDGHPTPYLYVGPWSSARPGDPAFWNVPFGAAMAWDGVSSGADAEAFFREGLARFPAAP